MPCDLVNGYSTREYTRALDQASALADLLQAETRYPRGTRVLEAGCGVGAQTLSLARNSPGAYFTCVDVCAESLYSASGSARAARLENVTFRQADLTDLPFAPGGFDHVFLSFVLEHLPDPGEALASLAAQLKPGGTLTAIEGDAGSTLFHPDDADARRAVECLSELHGRAGGDARVGRKLFPLLAGTGLRDVRVTPRMIYVDGSRPEWGQGFVLDTFTTMVAGVRKQAVQAGLCDEARFERGLDALRRTAGPGGVFCYTFFRGVGVKA